MQPPEGAPSPLPPPYRSKRSAALVVSERATAAGIPFSAMLEVADRCNEACVHCYQVQGQKGELDTADWERIMRELAELGVMFLTFSGGEVTLRKDFLRLVRYARELRFAVRIFTNGLNVDAAMAAELGRLSVQEVQISLYSQRAEVHDGVTRVPGSFERVVAAARELRAAGVKVLLKSPLMSLNAREYGEYVAFVTSLGCDYTLDPKLNPREDGDTAPTELSIDKQTYLELRRDVRFATPASARSSARAERPLDAAPCSACRGNVHIEPNGELRPCTQWSIPTGHALAGPLRDTWYGDPTARSIRGLTWNDLPGCRVCDLRAWCQRCFADAERIAGDALAPYARACQNALWKYEADVGVRPDVDGGDAQPVGPFRRVGEHRFLLEAFEPSSAPDARPLGVPAARRALSSAPLVSLRRHAAGPALTPTLGQHRSEKADPTSEARRAGSTVA
ncbi:MAG TPA: radical SAM protein [Polyangiaceae bacterium]|nr:radical SAM protein [Polyangiaceae bacterium]